ncbi:MAG: hypothetical protein Q4G13_05350, partial [Moraxella sp.]|nr:hypothetical protein [Moraxella sp.]
SAEIKAMRKNHDMQMAELLSKIEASSFNNAKIEAERRKFDAELRFYPWISAGITVLAIFALGMIAKYLGFV